MICAAQLKRVKALQNKKFRDEASLFVVEGEKMVQEALESDFEVVGIYRREEIGEDAMRRISSLSTPSPCLAVLRRKPPCCWQEALEGKPLALALDSVRDPGNMGTIIRIADWFGIDALFLSELCVDEYNPKVVQATMGSILRKKIIRCPLPALCREAKNRGLEVFGTFLGGENIYGCASLPESGIIVMGNESEGISEEVGREVGRHLTIPPFSTGAGPESLNVAIATAITVSEFRRRGISQ